MQSAPPLQRHYSLRHTCARVARHCSLWLLLLSQQSFADMTSGLTLAELKSQVSEFRKRHNIPVVSIHMVNNDVAPTTITLGGSPNTPLRWGSITKTVTALTVLNLHAQGRIELTAPLASYIRGTHWTNPWRKTHPITVLHLLELRAGLPDLSAQEFAFNEPITLHQALALNPSQRTVLWPPGLQHGYSNLTHGLTQLLIETVMEAPYDAAVKSLVFDPLDMQGASFAPSQALPGGFKADGSSPIAYWHMTFPAYGALNASITDMRKLLNALMGHESLPAATREFLLTPSSRHISPEFTFDYAAGFYPRVSRGHVWHTHGGDADGYRARIAFMANHPRGYIVNINTDNPSALRELEKLVESFLLDGLRPPPPAVEIPDPVHQWVGTYYPSTTRFGVAAWQAGQASTAHVFQKNGRLYFQRNGRTTELIATGNGQFRRAADPVSTVVFSRPKEGETTYLQGELGQFIRTSHCPKFLSAVEHCRE